MITLAKEAARRAGDVLLRNFGRASLTVESKAANDFVTEVDREAEDVIRGFLHEELPDHAFLLEEGGAIGAGSDWEWVVDPLDGTTNYIHRYPFFSVSLGLRHKGETVLGVIYDPLRHEMFSAEKGEGATLNGVPIAVGKTERLAQGFLCTGFPFRSREWLDAYLACFREMFLASSGMRRDGSAALDLAYVAAGRFDAFWELGLKPWDMAAGALLVREAGGRTSDFHGGDDFFHGGDIVASNGRIHEEILAVTRRVFASGRPRGA